jgi:hypothetical protein
MELLGIKKILRVTSDETQKITATGARVPDLKIVVNSEEPNNPISFEIGIYSRVIELCYSIVRKH